MSDSLWNPDGKGLRAGAVDASFELDPARGLPSSLSGDATIAQPGPINGATPQGAGGDGGGAALNLQFIVTITAGVATVAANSLLQQSYLDTDFLSLGGLGGGRPTTSPDKFWVEVDVDSSSAPYTFSNANVKSLGAGDSFDGGAVENDGNTPANQTKMRMVIATASGGVVIQCINSQIRIEQFIAIDSLDSGGGNAAKILAAYAYST